MFYESRLQQTRNVSGPAEAAQLIKSGQAADYEALTWPIDGAGQKCIVVNDGVIDDPWGEAAVILEQPGGERQQIESITAGWVDNTERLAEYFTSAIASPCTHFGPATLNFYPPTTNK